VPRQIHQHNTQDIFNNTRHGLILPVVAVFVISIMMITGLSVFSVRSLDKVSEAKSLHLAKSVFSDIKQKLTDLSFEYAYWDQAVENLVYDLDPVWGDENVGRYLHDVYNVNVSLVLNAANEVTYAAVNGERISDTSLVRTASTLKALVARARAVTGRDELPQTISGYVRYDDRLYFATAAVLTTYQTIDNEEVNTSTDSILIIMKELNDEVLANLTERYLLQDLRFDFSAASRTGSVSMDALDIDGVRLGTFQWKADTPGTEVLRWLLPAAIIIFLALGGLIFLSIRRATQASHAFIDALVGCHEAELERQLGQVQKMQALGIMVGGVAHNFNNLLQPILMLTQTMRKHTAQDSRDRADFNVIIQACERAIDLVGQISSFAHEKNINSGQRHDIYEVVDHGCRLAASTVPSSITMVTNLDKDTGVVLVDEVEVQTVLMNLISNAIDAMAGHVGEMTITLSRVLINGDEAELPAKIESGAYAKLTVSDTGVGMEQETLGRIFDPFYTTKGVGHGMGLGLSSTYGIVTRNDGAIHASSVPMKGSTFDVFFPLVDADDSPAQSS